MLHTPYKKLFSTAFLLIAGIFANIAFTGNAHAATSAQAIGSATVTLHVLADEPDANANTDQIDSDTDPAIYTDDETVENTDDEGEDMRLEEDTEEEINSGEDDGVEVYTEDSEELDLTAATATDSDGDPTTPDTGIITEVSEVNSFNPLPIVGLVIALAFIILLIKDIKDERASRIYRQLHRRANLFPNSRFGLNFRNERSRKLHIGKIIRYATLSGLAVFAGACLVNNNSTEETDAVANTYPYTISLTNGSNYDIYVKQGEFVRAAFKVTTTTNNPTGYTLTMAADNQALTASTGSLEPVTTDTSSANFADNTWGFSTNGTTYSHIPNTRSAGATLLHSTKGSSASGNYAVVYFGAKAASDLPVGDYTTTIKFASQTNVVKKTLKLLNGNVAKVTRVSDGSTLSNNSEIYVGEQLKITNAADTSGITQSAYVNGDAVSNGDTVTVSKNVKVSTSDDSMHFLKNTVSSTGDFGWNGDAILVKSQGKTWLVDTGHNQADSQWLNGAKVAAYLKELGITRLDYVLLTHAHGDHTGGINKLVSKGYIRSSTTVYLRGCEAVQDKDSSYENDGKPYAALRTSCNKKLNVLKNTANANVIDFYNHESERANLYKNGIDFGNFHVDFYNIEKGSNGHIAYDRTRENLNSIGTKWTHKPSGKTTFLSGDFEYGNEVTYGPKIGKVDILKAGHHGVRTSNTYEFYKKLNPSTVIVTSVNNPTGEGGPARQAAAWAYVEQKGGSVYFTGDSTGSAVAISFTKSGYTVKKGTKHSTIADANTGNKNDKTNYHRKAGSRVWSWNGGVVGWSRPMAMTGGDKVYWGLESANDKKHHDTRQFVYVYQSKTDGNIISQTNLCVGKTKYNFKTSYGDGVSQGRTKNAKGC